MFSAEPVCSWAAYISMQHACETAGAARTRSSPRPLYFKRANDMQDSGQNMPREREAAF